MNRNRNKESEIKLFEDLYHYAAGPEEQVAQVLSGHLAVEFLLRQLVCQYDQKLAALSDDLSHARLISLSRDIGTVHPKRAEVLLLINKLRNRFAHEIRYVPQLPELLVLFKAALAAYTDYSNGLKEGVTAISGAKNVYDLNKWLLSELFLAIIYDLHQEYVARGGDEEIPQSVT